MTYAEILSLCSSIVTDCQQTLTPEIGVVYGFASGRRLRTPSINTYEAEIIANVLERLDVLGNWVSRIEMSAAQARVILADNISKAPSFGALEWEIRTRCISEDIARDFENQSIRLKRFEDCYALITERYAAYESAIQAAIDRVPIDVENGLLGVDAAADLLAVLNDDVNITRMNTRIERINLAAARIEDTTDLVGRYGRAADAAADFTIKTRYEPRTNVPWLVPSGKVDFPVA